ncbi:MAG: hypothetical protein ACNA8W_05280 [Bradymonadaceae bacterium]
MTYAYLLWRELGEDRRFVLNDGRGTGYDPKGEGGRQEECDE